jgi:hypothetical protein
MWFCLLYSRRLLHLSLYWPTRSSALQHDGYNCQVSAYKTE